MSMSNCPACKNQVSKEAASCPHCGQPLAAKKSSKTKKGLYGCLGAIAVLGVIGAIGSMLTPQDGSSPGVSGRRTSARQAIKPINVTANTIAAEYKANEVAADMKYKGKWITVSGRVDSIGKGILGGMYVTLKSSRGQFQVMNFIQCFFDSKYQQQLASLQKGQSVVMLGRVDGKMGNIHVKGCRLVR